MNIVVIGTNHKFSPLEFRERISFTRRGLKQALLLLKENPVLEGMVILSTCNRVELYASVKGDQGIEELENFLTGFHELGKERILPYLYMYEGEEAIWHLFSVACGLDSLMLGETQILGQLKSGFSQALSAGCVDEYLGTVFGAAITFAKRIHQATEISEGKVSIASVAIDFIKEKLGSLSERNVLIIGAGKVTELVLKYLKEEKPRVVFISNRTFKKAQELALSIGQKAARFDKLPRLLRQADVVITATASPHFIIRKETLQGLALRKLLIIDLAVPRDVEPRVRQLSNVELFNLEDLRFVVQRNLEKKNLEAEKIKKLINQEAALLWRRLTVLEPELALLP